MATQAIEQVPAGTEEASAPKGKSVLIMALAGVLVGGAAGFFGVGPILAGKKAPAHAETAKKKEGGEGGEASGAVIHSIDNLVLNPAGSGGTRFLMVTATFEVKDGGVEQQMKDKEPEVRDRILALLGKKTIDELTDISLREGMKKEVLDAVTPLFPKGSIGKVFFPQFVIQ